MDIRHRMTTTVEDLKAVIWRLRLRTTPTGNPRIPTQGCWCQVDDPRICQKPDYQHHPTCIAAQEAMKL